MSDARDKLPAEFDCCFVCWRQADQGVRVALERYRAAPNAVNRLAIAATWAAIEPSINELSRWGRDVPQVTGGSGQCRCPSTLERLARPNRASGRVRTLDRAVKKRAGPIALWWTLNALSALAGIHNSLLIGPPFGVRLLTAI